MTRLTTSQVQFLLKPISAKRVQELRGMSHLEAWDIRRQLIRAFGFDGFTIETISLDLVSERETPAGQRSRWTVVYRAQVRLTLYGADGQRATFFEDAAAGDAVNQPSLGDAHDLAMKTALSQALKRCAVNLGDQFGLSLYNNGSMSPVVLRSIPHLGEPVPESEDAPVEPEPAPETQQPVPEVDSRAQAHANKAATHARGKDHVRERWADAAKNNLIDSVVMAPDTGSANSLAAYLTRLAETLPEKAPASESSGQEPKPLQDAEAASAETELRAVAARVHLPNVDEEFRRSYGISIEEARPAQLREMASILTGSAA